MKQIILAMSLISLFSLVGHASDVASIYCRGDASAKYFGSHNPQVTTAKFKLRHGYENDIVETYYRVSLSKVPESKYDYTKNSAYSTKLKDKTGFMDIEMYIDYNSSIITGVLYNLTFTGTGTTLKSGGTDEYNSFLDIVDYNKNEVVSLNCKRGIDTVLYVELP